jgi:hypothetical protein
MYYIYIILTGKYCFKEFRIFGVTQKEAYFKLQSAELIYLYDVSYSKDKHVFVHYNLVMSLN